MSPLWICTGRFRCLPTNRGGERFSTDPIDARTCGVFSCRSGAQGVGYRNWVWPPAVSDGPERPIRNRARSRPAVLAPEPGCGLLLAAGLGLITAARRRAGRNSREVVAELSVGQAVGLSSRRGRPSAARARLPVPPTTAPPHQAPPAGYNRDEFVGDGAHHQPSRAQPGNNSSYS